MQFDHAFFFFKGKVMYIVSFIFFFKLNERAEPPAWPWYMPCQDT